MNNKPYFDQTERTRFKAIALSFLYADYKHSKSAFYAYIEELCYHRRNRMNP